MGLIHFIAYMAAVFSGLFWWESGRLQLVILKEQQIPSPEIDDKMRRATQMNKWAGILALISATAFFIVKVFW